MTDGNNNLVRLAAAEVIGTAITDRPDDLDADPVKLRRAQAIIGRAADYYSYSYLPLHIENQDYRSQIEQIIAAAKGAKPTEQLSKKECALKRSYGAKADSPVCH